MNLNNYLLDINSKMESHFANINIPQGIEMIKRALRITRSVDWIPDREVTFDELCKKLFDILNPKFIMSRAYIAFGIMFTGMSSGKFKITYDDGMHQNFVDHNIKSINSALTKVQDRVHLNDEDRFWVDNLLIWTPVDPSSKTALPLHKKYYDNIVHLYGPH